MAMQREHGQTVPHTLCILPLNLPPTLLLLSSSLSLSYSSSSSSYSYTPSESHPSIFFLHSSIPHQPTFLTPACGACDKYQVWSSPNSIPNPPPSPTPPPLHICLECAVPTPAWAQKNCSSTPQIFFFSCRLQYQCGSLFKCPQKT